MQKWIFKIDTPCGKKGDELPRDSNGHYSRFCIYLSNDDLAKYPGLFELVEEKSDRELLLDWFKFHESIPYGLIVDQLINVGLDVKKLGLKK